MLQCPDTGITVTRGITEAVRRVNLEHGHVGVQFSAIAVSLFLDFSKPWKERLGCQNL